MGCISWKDWPQNSIGISVWMQNSSVHNGPEMPKIGQKSKLASHDRILMFEVSNPMFFGTRNLNLALLFTCEHSERAHERARTQKHFKMHDVYQIICFLGQKIQIWHYFFRVSTMGARTNERAHRLTLKCMMYIELYVFRVKKARSDIIFFLRAPWARARTRARTH